MRNLILILTLVLMAVPSLAAIDRKFERKSALTKKTNQYIRDGQFFGGKSGNGYSLTDVRRVYSNVDKVERVILELGDEQGLPTTDLAYFQVNLYKDLKRIDIDMAQMRGAALDQKKVEALFKASPNVKSVKLNYDPEDHSIIVQLLLKQEAEIEVIKMPGTQKHGKIALDIRTLTRRTVR
ncbi:MAG: hypothetical protein AABZ31_11125 [Bdellovibrionota bacterium]